MTTTPTQLPVPSEKPQDLKFNAGKIDEFVTSMEWTYTDRFGNKHYTIEGINYLAQQVMNAFGYVTLTGVNFTTGATLSNPNEVLFNTADSSYYKWTGSFASGGKVVPASSTPESSGGVGPGKWLNVGDSALRSDLASTSGASIITASDGKSVQEHLDKIPELYAEEFGDLSSIDATLVLQSAINSASSQRRELRVKTPVINVSQLSLPNNTILNLGACTLKQIAASNKPLLRNTTWGFTNKTYTNNRICIIDGILDFNGANQADTTSTGEINVGCAFFGVDGLYFRGSTKFINSRRYNFFSANCANLSFDTPVIYNDPTIPSYNKDGLHLCGNIYGVNIKKLYVYNPEDDSLALNADDVDHGGQWTRDNITGPIENVHVGQVIMDGPASHNGVRLLSASPSTPISNVSIEQITGVVDNYFLNIESFGLGESCAYHNIAIGTVGGVYAVRSNSAFVQGMVNIYTMKPNGAVVNDIHIRKIFRDQVVGDGELRPTVQLGIERTSIVIDEIIEQNCANDATVRVTEVGPSAFIEVGNSLKTSTRTLTPGIYGAVISATNVNINKLSLLKIDNASADHLRHLVLASYIHIKQLDVFHDGSADNIPIYLTSSQVDILHWNSSVQGTYQFTAQRYTLAGSGSAVILERPAVTGGSTAERPINAIIGDSFYDTTTNARVNWNGVSWV